jgi:hypothetical protein
MTKTYTLTITEEQARALQYATDVLQRVQLGQWEEIVDWLPLKKPTDYTKLHEDRRTIGKILSEHMVDQIDGYGSSLDVGHPDLPKNNGVLYDLHCVIRKKLAWERAVETGVIESEDSPRKWPEMMQVCYDDPMKWGSEPLAVMERIDAILP